MPAKTVLHIQPPGQTATRVVALEGTAVRVGYGAQCEVRLESERSTEVECILRRRGEAWHIQPVDTQGRLTLNGVSVERQCPLPRGQSLFVGEFVLTLHDEPTQPDSIPVDVDANDVVTVPFRRVSSEVSTSSDEDQKARLAGWQAGLARRERWLKARKDEIKWEKRWRASGERLRSRPTDESTENSSAVERRQCHPELLQPPRTDLPVIDDFPETSRDEAVREVDRRKLGSVSQLGHQLENRFQDHPTSSLLDPEPLDVEELDARQAWESSEDLGTIEVDIEPLPSFDLPEGYPNCDPRPEFKKPEAPTDVIADGLTHPHRTPEPPPVRLPTPDQSSNQSPSSVIPIDRLTGELVWPSVREILESHRDAATFINRRPKPAHRPTSSDCEAPTAWTVPAWMIAPPSLALTLLIGIVALVLNWKWAEDDLATAALADRLLSGEPIIVESIGPELLATTTPAWWGTTADHLLIRAAASGIDELDAVRRERAAELTELAASVSPAHAATRHARAALAEFRGQALDEPYLEGATPSRDVVSLEAEARRRLRTGRIDEALTLYRDALSLATRIAPADATPATFDNDSRVRRHYLPNEDLVAPMLYELASQRDLGYENWSIALPNSALVRLSAYRALVAAGSPDADRALQDVLTQSRTVEGDLAAVEAAARAEALAFLARFEDSEIAYRVAIRSISTRMIRREWWLNLAEIRARIGDLEGAREAREAAHALTSETESDIEQVALEDNHDSHEPSTSTGLPMEEL